MKRTHTITLTKNGEEVTYDKDLAAIVATLRNGQYTLTVAPKRQRRSLDQNALMWLWFECIATETGTPSQQVHDHYCKKFLRKTIEWNGQQEVVVQGTRKLDKESFTNFLDNVQADAAAEFGIRLPLPEDLYFDEFYHTYQR